VSKYPYPYLERLEKAIEDEPEWTDDPMKNLQSFAGWMLRITLALQWGHPFIEAVKRSGFARDVVEKADLSDIFPPPGAALADRVERLTALWGI